MPTCAGCALREGVTCTCPRRSALGGPGLPMKHPEPTVMMVDGVRGGKRCGWSEVIYHGPVTCEARVAAAEQPETRSAPTSAP
jgi:hypothetical protein